MRGRRDAIRWRSVVRAFPLLILWAGGCELMIKGKLDQVHCDADGMVGPPACQDGFACNAGLCVPTDLGGSCKTDADCAPGDFCLDPRLFGESSPRTCSRTCCTSSDCDPDSGFVCSPVRGGAGSFCLEAGSVQRARPGARKAWETCTGDSDCRSGRCMHGHCIDTCCSDTGCATGGGACRLDRPSDSDVWGFWCAAVPGQLLPRYAPCLQDADCISGLCVDTGLGLRCSAPCCSSETCETLDKSIPVRCATVTHQGAVLRACSTVVQGLASLEVGDACTTDGDCRSGRCVTEGAVSMCGDSCCTDAFCGDQSSFVCRPMKADGAWALRCTPK